MPAAVAIPAAIGLATSIGSGYLGSRAAGKAADLQYRAGLDAAGRVRDAGDQGARIVTDASGRAINVFNEASGDAQDRLADVYNWITSTTSPYMRMGEQGVNLLSDYMQPGGRLNTPFSYSGEDLYNDPSYQFRLKEGQKALESSAAARGVLGTSGTLKGITQYGQNMASTEFQNAYNRALSTYNTNQTNTRSNLGMMISPGMDAMRIQTGAAQNYGNTSAQLRTNLGSAVGNTMLNEGQWLANTGISIADIMGGYMTGAANAKGAGVVGAANAWGNTLGNIGNLGMWVGSQMNQRANYGDGGGFDNYGGGNQYGLGTRPTTVNPDGSITVYDPMYRR